MNQAAPKQKASLSRTLELKKLRCQESRATLIEMGSHGLRPFVRKAAPGFWQWHRHLQENTTHLCDQLDNIEEGVTKFETGLPLLTLERDLAVGGVAHDGMTADEDVAEQIIVSAKAYSEHLRAVLGACVINVYEVIRPPYIWTAVLNACATWEALQYACRDYAPWARVLGGIRRAMKANPLARDFGTIRRVTGALRQPMFGRTLPRVTTFLKGWYKDSTIIADLVSSFRYELEELSVNPEARRQVVQTLQAFRAAFLKGTEDPLLTNNQEEIMGLVGLLDAMLIHSASENRQAWMTAVARGVHRLHSAASAAAAVTPDGTRGKRRRTARESLVSHGSGGAGTGDKVVSGPRDIPVDGGRFLKKVLVWTRVH